jgi:hypothetical protein
VERALSEQPGDPERAVVTAWRRTAADLTGVRAVLDRAAEETESPRVRDMLSTARRNDHTMMATTAGLASGRDPRAARVGRRLEQQARDAGPLPPATGRADQRERDQGVGSLLRRIRSHLAA